MDKDELLKVVSEAHKMAGPKLMPPGFTVISFIRVLEGNHEFIAKNVAYYCGIVQGQEYLNSRGYKVEFGWASTSALIVSIHDRNTLSGMMNDFHHHDGTPLGKFLAIMKIIARLPKDENPLSS